MRPVVLLASLAVAGCGLDKEGLGPRDFGDGGRVPQSDGGMPVTDSAPGGPLVDVMTPPWMDAGTCLASVPAGWSVVAYETSRVACPAGYSASYDGVASPQAAPGACSCMCNPTSQPTCDSGSLHISFGPSSSCSSTAPPVGVGGGCSPLQPGGPAAQVMSVPPLGLSGGACTGTAIGDTTKITSSEVRYCVVPPGTAEGVCEGSPPSGFSSCIASPGDVQCPAGSPFTNRTLLGDTQTLVCSACTSCGFQGTCTGATVKFFSDYICNGSMYVGTFPADGTCTQPSFAGNQVHSIQYQAQVSATCSATGSAAMFQAIGAQTVCCR